MADIVALAPHDPLPRGPSIVVMRHFAEENPNRAAIEIVLTHRDGQREVFAAVTAGGAPLDFDAAVREAVRLAREHSIQHVFRIDRLEGTREQKIIARHGDHSAHGDRLAETDPDETTTGGT